ncbi:MAG: hypothetical protein ACN4G0_14235, partial [Polyangiales bacterium]
MRTAAHSTPARGFRSEPTRARSEWTALLDMVPAGFDLMSPASIARQGLEMVSNATNTKRYLNLLTEAQQTLREARIPVLVRDHQAQSQLLAPTDLKRAQRRWLGQVTLELYFTQL